MDPTRPNSQEAPGQPGGSGGEPDPSEPPEEHEGGLSQAFLERAISLRSMSPTLLAITVVPIAQAVVAAGLLATRDVPWPLVPAGTLPGGQVLATLPLPTLVAAAVFMVLAWSYVLTGALHGHGVLRVVGLGTYSLMALLAAVTATFDSGAAAAGNVGESVLIGVAILLVLLGVWAAAAGLWIVDRSNAGQAPHLHHRERLWLPTFLFVVGATGLIYLLSGLAGLRSGGFGRYLYAEMLLLQFILIPVLFLAGTDFAEWSEVVSGRIASAGASLAGRFGPWVLAAAIAATAVGIVLHYLWQSLAALSVNVVGIAIVVAPAIVALGLVGLLGALAVPARPSPRVPLWALGFAAVTVYAGVGAAAVIGFVTAPAQQEPQNLPVQGLVAYEHDQRPQFAMEVPQGWRSSPVQDGVAFRGADTSGFPVQFLVLQVPAGAGDAAEAQAVRVRLERALGGPVQLEGQRQQGRWQVQDLHGTAFGTQVQGRLWTRTEGGSRWLLVGTSPLLAGGSYTPLFDTLVGSWHSGTGPVAGTGSRAAGPAPVDYLVGTGAASLVLLVVGGVLLRRGRERGSAGLFLMATAVFNLFGPLGLAQAGAQLHLHWLQGVLFVNVLMTLALAALVFLAVQAVRRRIGRTSIPLLRLGLILLLGMVGLLVLYYAVFGTILEVQRFTLAAALLLVAAMVWDVVLSGDAVTNVHGRHVPRHSRVLLYFGYTMMVTTLVVFFSSLSIQGGGTAGLEFDSDIWPQTGIAVLGIPLLLTFFVINLGAWRHRQRVEEGPPIDREDLADA